MLQHRTIFLAEDIHADLDVQIGMNAQDVPIEGSVEELAE